MCSRLSAFLLIVALLFDVCATVPAPLCGHANDLSCAGELATLSASVDEISLKPQVGSVSDAPLFASGCEACEAADAAALSTAPRVQVFPLLALRVAAAPELSSLFDPRRLERPPLSRA